MQVVYAKSLRVYQTGWRLCEGSPVSASSNDRAETIAADSGVVLATGTAAVLFEGPRASWLLMLLLLLPDELLR